MRSKEAIQRAQKKYDQNAIKRLTVKLNKKLDEDIVNHLDGKGNITAYIKQLIRTDIAKGGE